MWGLLENLKTADEEPDEPECDHDFETTDKSSRSSWQYDPPGFTFGDADEVTLSIDFTVHVQEKCVDCGKTGWRSDRHVHAEWEPSSIEVEEVED